MSGFARLSEITIGTLTNFQMARTVMKFYANKLGEFLNVDKKQEKIIEAVNKLITDSCDKLFAEYPGQDSLFAVNVLIQAKEKIKNKWSGKNE